MEKHGILSTRTVTFLAATVFIFLLLYFGRTLFVPMFYGLFIAIVLYPVCRWLENHGFSKSMAITTGLLLVLAVFTALVWILVLQFNAFMQDLPELKAKLLPSLTGLQNWLADNFNFSIASQNEWWQKTSESLSGNSSGMVAGIFDKTVSGLFSLFIIPVFAALFLYNRKDFVLFLEKLTGDVYKERLHHILNQTIITYFHFIKGMTFVYLIVGVLNSIGLLAL
ncbi:MAG TPA: AI-2E family transporter, partial [Ferruginibacter sp.]|nr:AI-2E family transporter [Ferruginibacter sp.]